MKKMIRVWVVDDNASFRRAVIDEINDDDGLRCERDFGACESLLEGLAHAPAPEVFLMDIGLPGLSGLEAISAVKARAPDSEIIMLTMFDDQDRIFRALCAGASGYLLKSSNEDIAAAIHEAVKGGAPLSRPIARAALDYFTRSTPVSNDYRLSDRERKVLQLMAEGRIKKEIADTLKLSYHTVDDHLKRIYRKLHVNNGTAAVAKAIRERLC